MSSINQDLGEYLFVSVKIGEQSNMDTGIIEDIYTKQNVSSVHEALSILFPDDQETKSQCFVLYVQGRYSTPTSSERSCETVIPLIESIYNCRVLMFHWASTQEKAHSDDSKAAKCFGQVLKDLFNAKNTKLEARKCTLLTHSLGSFELEQYLNQSSIIHQPGSLGRNLFDNVLICSADSLTDDHVNWLERIDFAKRTYVTFNNKDSVLKASNKLTGRLSSKLLGYKPTKSINGQPFKQASNAQYVDFTGLVDTQHRYFLPSHQPDKKFGQLIVPFFAKVFRGEAAVFEKDGPVLIAKDLISKL